VGDLFRTLWNEEVEQASQSFGALRQPRGLLLEEKRMSGASHKEAEPPESTAAVEEHTVVLPAEAAPRPAGLELPWPTEPPRALPPHEPDPTISPGRTLAGRYTVLQPLGQGGMGVVLAAYDALLDRRVALKLLQPRGLPTSSREAAQAWLLREAKAMARLNHPNVVHVYDAGTLEDGRIFVAMEHVEGQTLRRWSQQQERSWSELLGVYQAAGQGLAAAHAAGLVHRDFKPDNVLVGKDGRVRVMDFGVARLGPTTSASSPTPSPHTAAAELAQGAWEEVPLVGQGMVPGTPKYMAPELLRGGAADTRSDLFAFCVALYEDLYRQPPFGGARPEERRRAQLEGRVSPLPAASKVPAWVGRAVLQGLATDSAQRPPSMEALLQALAHSPVRLRTRWVATVAPVVAVLGLCGWALTAWDMRTAERLQLCSSGPQRLQGVWDEPMRLRVQQAFAATGKPFAQDAFVSAQQALDGYARAWVAMHRQACEATRLHREQSEQVLTLRMACLERRLLELEGLVKVFAQADGPVVQQAAQAARGLPALEGCADVEALSSEMPLPEQVGKRTRVEELRQEMARGRALLLGGRYSQASEAALTSVGRARALDYPPVLAEALLDFCASVYRLDLKAGLRACTEAVWVANGQRQDRIATRATIYLMQFLNEEGEHERSRWWQEYASSMLERLGRPPQLEAQYLGALAIGHVQRGESQQAREAYERYRLLALRTYGPDDPQTLSAENNAAVGLEILGHAAEAARLLGQSAQRFERLLGPHHPGLALRLSNLADAQADTGELEAAQEALERSARIIRETLPAGSRYHAAWSSVAAAVALARGRYGEAQRHAREALAVYERLELLRGLDGPTTQLYLGRALLKGGQAQQALELLQEAAHSAEQQKGEGNAELAVYWGAVASAQQALGRAQEALRLRERGLRHALRHEQGQGPWTALARLELADSLLHLGKHKEALEQARQAQPTLRELLGPLAPRLGEALRIQGEALLVLRRPAEAVALLEQAVLVAEGSALDPNERAWARFLLARALAESAQRPERQAELLTQARQDFSSADIPDLTHRAELERWARSHPR
jgi:eukaryotic-like serine/threonine-protein kinase